MTKIKGLILALAVAICCAAFTSGQVVPKTKHISHKVYHKSHHIATSTWHHGKRISKKTWRKGNHIGHKVAHKTKKVMVGDDHPKP
jgi:hypothetical protein